MEQVITGSKLKIAIKADSTTLQFLIVQLAGVSTPSAKKEEVGAAESIDYMRQYLFKELSFKFTGECEKFTGALLAFAF